MERLPFEIPDPHEGNPSVKTSVELPDYHPIKEAELSELLSMASLSRNPIIYAKVKVRLYQAIPGMTSPRPINGHAYNRMNELDTVFERGLEEGILPILGSRIGKIFL